MLKSKIFWVALILLMFVPMVVTFSFADDLVAVFRNNLGDWNLRPDDYILSDILFYEAGFFLAFGAMLAGAVFFLGWKTDRLGLFVEPVFRWTIIGKEREIPAALLLGLLLIFVGVVYISASIAITF